MKIIPQTLWILICVYTIHSQYMQYKKQVKLFPRKQYRNFWIGIVALNLIFYSGGFFNVFFE